MCLVTEKFSTLFQSYNEIIVYLLFLVNGHVTSDRLARVTRDFDLSCKNRTTLHLSYSDDAFSNEREAGPVELPHEKFHHSLTQ